MFLLWMLACGATQNPEPAKLEASITHERSVKPFDLATASAATRAYDALLKGGCDVAGPATHVWTPLEARLLRNAPYARQGYIFSNAELASYFETADKSWYRPSTKEVTLSAADMACVETLKAHETFLRESWPVPPPMEARILRHPATFKAFWEWGHRSPEKHYDLVMVKPEADGGLTVQLMSPGCDPAGECSAVMMVCDATGECVALAAG